MTALPGIVAWGGYDEGKPRARLLLDALRRRRSIIREINSPIWAGIEDKSVLPFARFISAGLRLLLSYPKVLAQLLRMPKGTIVLLPYPGIPDIFVLWPFAAMRSWTVVFDAFIPLHEAIVVDRDLVSRKGIVGRIIWHVERLALRIADIVLADTDQHAEYLSQEYGVDPLRLQTVLVGAEPVFWDCRNDHREPTQLPGLETVPAGRPVVLFYGQLIPLHGLSTILDAVRSTADEPFHWVIVGSGQLERQLHDFLSKGPVANLSWSPWIDYSQLPHLIRRATVALGIFGTSDKAARVIPNKVFQVLAAGRPVITRSSPAVDALAKRYPDAVITVPCGDAAALSKAVRQVVAAAPGGSAVPASAKRHLGPDDGVDELLLRLAKLEGHRCKQR